MGIGRRFHFLTGGINEDFRSRNRDCGECVPVLLCDGSTTLCVVVDRNHTFGILDALRNVRVVGIFADARIP